MGEREIDCFHLQMKNPVIQITALISRTAVTGIHIAEAVDTDWSSVVGGE